MKIITQIPKEKNFEVSPQFMYAVHVNDEFWGDYTDSNEYLILYQQEVQEAYKTSPVHLIKVIEAEQNLRDQADDSYLTLPISIVIGYDSKLYRSDGKYGSYGTEDWTEWYEVELKEIITYDYIKI